MKTQRLKTYILLFFISVFHTFADAQGISAPSAIGAWGNMIYAGSGVTIPQPYHPNPDMIATLGFGLGNPSRNIGVQLGPNMLDVSEQDTYNFGLKLHRYITKGVSVAVGVENLFAFDIHGNFDFQANRLTDAGTNYYFTTTHNLGHLFPYESPASRITYSIGAGLGRFSELSPKDIAAGKPNENGTYVFGAFQYQLVRDRGILDGLNFHVEWNGVNLNSGFTITSHLGPIPFTILASAADLTPYSGDRIRFIGAVGVAYQIGGKDKKGSSGRKRRDKSDVNEALIAQNELMAQNENLKKQNEKILASKTELKRKVEILEKEVKKIKEEAGVTTDDTYTDDTYTDDTYTDDDYDPTVTDDGEDPRPGDLVDMNDDYIVKVNEAIDAGYHIEPGNYVVIHSLKKREWAENTKKNYDKIGIETHIAYNVDKEMHYVYTHKFPLSELKKALLKSTEQRKKGFKGAWVFIKERDPNAMYYQRQNIDSILTLSDNIVRVGGDSAAYPIAPGNYLVIHTMKQKHPAEEEAARLRSKGINCKVMYNRTRMQHYLYTRKYDDIDAALAKRRRLLREFNGAWVLVRKSDASEGYTADADLEGIEDLRDDEIIKISSGTDANYGIAPGNYVVVEAFRIEENAYKAVDILRDKGVTAYIAFNKDRKIYYIYTHMFVDPDEARRQRDEWREGEFRNAWIFTY